MNADDIAQYIKERVPTFTDIEILPAGKAYHYTPHADKIEAANRFLGAPLSPDLDHTQVSLKSPPATSDPGVVFAYASQQDASEEGFGMEILEVMYKAAVRASHSQEVELGAPPTILISSIEITSLRRVDNFRLLKKQ